MNQPTTIITFFPKPARHAAPCQFCGTDTQDILSKTRDGRWVTTCDGCFTDRQGVSPVWHLTSSHDGYHRQFHIARNRHGSSGTLFTCATCSRPVAYTKSKSGKWYLANVDAQGYIATYAAHHAARADSDTTWCQYQQENK